MLNVVLDNDSTDLITTSLLVMTLTRLPDKEVVIMDKFLKLQSLS